MKTKFWLFVVLFCSGIFSKSTLATPFDLAVYIGLVPGNWAIFQDTATGEQWSYVTSINAQGQTVQTWYQLEGSTWVFDSADLFTVTSSRIRHVGFNDGTAVWWLLPSFSLARQQDVNRSLVYRGVRFNPATNEIVPVVQTLSFVAQNLGVSVPAGTFTNCVKIRLYSYSAESSRDSVSIDCPNRLEVKSWYNKISDTDDPVVEDQSESHSLVMIQAGDSDAPLP